MTDRIRPSLLPWLAALALGLGGLALAGCTGDDTGTATEGSVPQVEEAPAEVEFEPAYPEDVTEEGLTGEDTRQQETAHSHDGEAHAHDDEGEDDHDHGDDGHDH